MNKEIIPEEDLLEWEVLHSSKNGRTQLLGNGNQRIVLDTKDKSIVWRGYGLFHIPVLKIKKGSKKLPSSFYLFFLI